MSLEEEEEEESRALLMSLEDEEESLEFELELELLRSIKLNVSNQSRHSFSLLSHSQLRFSSHNFRLLSKGSRRHTLRALLVLVSLEDEESLEFELEFELGTESSTSFAFTKELSIGMEHTKRHLLAVSSILSLESMI